ncbi:unnamed protein product, partial [marine sediment metagenome]
CLMVDWQVINVSPQKHKSSYAPLRIILESHP